MLGERPTLAPPALLVAGESMRRSLSLLRATFLELPTAVLGPVNTLAHPENSPCGHSFKERGS